MIDRARPQFPGSYPVRPSGCVELVPAKGLWIRCRSQPPEVFPGSAPGQKACLAPEPPAEAEDSPVLAKAILLGRCARRCGLSESGARLRRCHVISRENGSLPTGSKNNALLHGLHAVLPRGRRGWTKDSGRPVEDAHHAYYLF